MIIERKNRSNKYNPVHKKMHELWRSMIGRCTQPRSSSYKNYGALGVTICEKWMTYEGFLDDIDSVEGFDIDLLIKGELQLDKDLKQKDRKTEEKVYSLETCTFVSRSINASNRYNNKEFIAIHLEKDLIEITNNREEFCRKYELDSSTVFRILKNNNGESNKYSARPVKFYYGWTFIYTDNLELNRIPKRRIYIFTDTLNNTEYKGASLRGFCMSNNLSYNEAQAVLKGKQEKFSEYWTVKQEILDYKSATTIERALSELNLDK